MDLQDRKERISGDGGELGSAREIMNMNLQERKERISGRIILQQRPLFDGATWEVNASLRDGDGENKCTSVGDIFYENLS